MFRCHALATAPASGHCSVFALKQVDEIRHEIDAWIPSSPKSFRPFREVGIHPCPCLHANIISNVSYKSMDLWSEWSF